MSVFCNSSTFANRRTKKVTVAQRCTNRYHVAVSGIQSGSFVRSQTEENGDQRKWWVNSLPAPLSGYAHGFGSVISFANLEAIRRTGGGDDDPRRIFFCAEQVLFDFFVRVVRLKSRFQVFVEILRM